MTLRGHVQPPTILMADDDEDDRLLVKSALEEVEGTCGLRFVSDGKELMDYLCREGKFSAAESYPFPDLIILDINMPKKKTGEKPWRK